MERSERRRLTAELVPPGGVFEEEDVATPSPDVPRSAPETPSAERLKVATSGPCARSGKRSRWRPTSGQARMWSRSAWSADVGLAVSEAGGGPDGPSWSVLSGRKIGREEAVPCARTLQGAPRRV